MIWLICLLPLSPAFSHGAIHDQLKSTDERIKKEPDNAELYIHRGRLYLDDGHIGHARENFRRALALDPRQRAAHYFLADALLKDGDALGAEQEAQIFIASLTPADKGGLVRGYRLLGRSLTDQEKHVDAANAYRRAIDHAGEPGPDQFIECASAYSAAGSGYRQKALQTLDEGLTRLGLLSTLQEAAVEIEIQSGNTDGAVRRLDSLIALGKRREHLLYRKGAVLAQAHQGDEAGQAYEEALSAIKELKPNRRNSKAVQKLQADIEAGLKALKKKS
ncbi:MAG: tetratricopeptide repeat protein [Gammaproteobacteria bacterium]